MQNLRAEPTKIPRAGELHCGCVVHNIKPPDRVIQLLSHEFVVGVDIHTHDWETNGGSKGGIGQFGFYTRDNSNSAQARIVQLGWTLSDCNGVVTTKERLVKNDGFVISDKAAQHHGITNKNAALGHNIRNVLHEFMSDMMEAVSLNGGRVVIHHLELDAAIISHELHRAGMRRMQEMWESIARRGICTMDPELGRWVRQCFDFETSPNINLNTMRLNFMLNRLVPPEEGTVSRVTGSEKHVMLYLALQRLLKDFE